MNSNDKIIVAERNGTSKTFLSLPIDKVKVIHDSNLTLGILKKIECRNATKLGVTTVSVSDNFCKKEKHVPEGVSYELYIP